MVLLIVLAHVFGVVQLAVLGWAARTVRLRVLLLALFAGVYAVVPVTVLVQVAWTRGFASFSGTPLFQVTRMAAYTVNPFVEELLKLLPLLLLWWLVMPVRRQWGWTDFVLVGGALGSGFGLAEALLRFAGDAGGAVAQSDGGWSLPVDLSLPTVPGPWQIVTSWLPAGVAPGLLFSNLPGAGLNLHLVWGCVVGLGAALLLRGPGRRARLLGVGLVLLVGVDHAAFNARLSGGDLANALTAPLNAARPLMWAYPLLALAVAVVVDRRALAAQTRLRTLAGDAGPVPSVTSGAAPRPVGGQDSDALRPPGRPVPLSGSELVRPALARLPWSVTTVLGFVRLRRAWLLSGRDGPVDPVLGAATVRLGAALADGAGPDGPRVWRETLRRRRELRQARGGRWRRPLLVVWALLLAVPVLYLVVGGLPALAGVQGAVEAAPWLLVAVSVFGACWAAVALVLAVRGVPAARRAPSADVPVGLLLRLGTLIGSLGVLLTGLWLLTAGGRAPVDGLLRTAHALDAIGQTLVAVGIVLALAALVASPPFALVAVAGGGMALAGTGLSAALLAQLAVAGTVSLTGVALMQASGEGGGPSRGEPSRGGSRRQDLGEEEPVAGLEYTTDELAQLAYQHSRVQPPAPKRPDFKEIHQAITRAEPQPLPGQNAVKFEYGKVRVIINKDLPWKSTTYYINS